jgi:hypothetical protein
LRYFYGSGGGHPSRMLRNTYHPYQINNKKLHRKDAVFYYGSGGGIRTHNQSVNSRLLYR